MNVFVTGGLGYIGSHTCVELVQAGHQVVIADNLSNSRLSVLDAIETITGQRPDFYRADVCDKAALREIFAAHAFDAVLHFAGLKAVNESLTQPLAYYRNNFDAALSLLEVMEEFGCKRLVFSSSATVYGPGNPIPYVETMPAHVATNPYGWTKVMIEQLLRDYAAAKPDFSAVLLRYFNPIGAHESGLLGDDPNGIPNNLMPYVARVAAGQLEKLTIFGNDYDTPDGTCRRDFLHVVDLAKGHLKALDYAMTHCGAEPINLGTGSAVSVKELVDTFERATGVPVPHSYGPRRAGDLPDVYANAEKAKRLLGWQTEKTLEDMCRDSWRFVQKQH